MPVRNISAPAARRGRHLIPVISRTHATSSPLGPRYYLDLVLGLKPVLYLRQNEKFGTGGIAFDSSSSAANGVVNGTVTKIQTGPLVGDPTSLGYLYDGATGFVDLGAPPPSPLLAAFQNHDFTIEAWVNAVSATNFIFSFGLTNNPSNNDAFFQFGFSGGNFVRFGFFGDDAQGVFPVTTGAYHHLVGSWSAATKQQAIYVDGMADVVRTSTGALNVPNNADAQVGRAFFATGNGPFFFNGTISELAVYPFVLTPAQVTQHFLRGTNAVPSALPPIITEA